MIDLLLTPHNKRNGVLSVTLCIREKERESRSSAFIHIISSLFVLFLALNVVLEVESDSLAGLERGGAQVRAAGTSKGVTEVTLRAKKGIL